MLDLFDGKISLTEILTLDNSLLNDLMKLKQEQLEEDVKRNERAAKQLALAQANNNSRPIKSPKTPNVPNQKIVTNAKAKISKTK